MVYALKDKEYFQFHCISKTELELEDRIDRAYWNWKGSRSRSEPEEMKTKEVYLERFIKVKITVNKI